MFKTFKEWLQSKGIDESAYAAKSAQEMATLQKEYMEYVSTEMKTAVEGNAKKSDIDEAVKSLATTEALKGYVKAEDMDAFKTRLEEAEEKANQAIENATKEQLKQSFAEQVKSHILQNKDAWNNLKEDKNQSVSFVVKAVGNMTIAGNTTGRVARIEVDPERVGVARRSPFVMSLVNAGRTTAKTIYWVEREAHEGAVTFVAEGAAKPQVDWNYVERSRPVEKVPAWTKISKEMLDDVDGISQDIAEELTEQIMLKADASLLTGDGTSNELVGIAENATAFAPGTALANQVATANEMDVLRAAIAQVYRNNFVPTDIVVHPDKAALMDLKKGTDGHYLLPPFITADGTNVKGIPVTANNGVGIDTFFVGDFSKYKVKVREDISIQIGYDGDDWTKNFVTPLAEMRLAGYIASNNYGAIVSGTFTVGKALLDPAVADS